MEAIPCLTFVVYEISIDKIVKVHRTMDQLDMSKCVMLLLNFKQFSYTCFLTGVDKKKILKRMNYCMIRKICYDLTGHIMIKRPTGYITSRDMILVGYNLRDYVCMNEIFVTLTQQKLTAMINTGTTSPTIASPPSTVKVMPGYSYQMNSAATNQYKYT